MQRAEFVALLGFSSAAIALVYLLRQLGATGNGSREKVQEDNEEERAEREESEVCEPSEATLTRDNAHSLLGGDQTIALNRDEEAPKESDDSPPKDEQPARRNRRHSDFAVASIIS